MVEREAFEGDILVIGGGISGLTAAIEAAEAGYRVIIVRIGDQLQEDKEKSQYPVYYPG